MITGNTLNYWLAKEQIDIRTIGIFTIISIPYAINFLWAPIFDTVKLGFLTKAFGARVSWILLIYGVLAVFVFILSLFDPRQNLLYFGIIGFLVAFLSSTGDTVIGALKTEIISKESQGAASGFYILGYRIGTLLSSSGAIFLSAYISWGTIYKLFTIIILLCPILLIFHSKNINVYFDKITIPYPKILYKKFKIIEFINAILKQVGSWYFITLTLSFLILYRLPDNFISTIINPFLIHLEYNELEIASIGKFFGISGSIIGGLLASFIMNKRSIISALLIFGAVHAIAHSLFIVQEIYGKNIYLLITVIGIESITGGMSMAAYIAFIASLCHGRFRATQYSFFSSMMGLSRSILPSISGYLVAVYGWQNFFVFVTIATVPSLLIAWKLSKI